MVLKGKQLSLGAKIVASIIVVMSLVLKVLRILPEIDIMDSIRASLFVAALFAPVDVSLILEKIFPQNIPPTLPGGGL